MQDIQEMHLDLQEQLQQFERKQEQIGEGIIEAQRRISILDEAMSRSPIELAKSYLRKMHSKLLTPKILKFSG